MHSLKAQPIAEQIDRYAQTFPDADAILDASGRATTYCQLRNALGVLTESLEQADVARGATVVLLLPDGPALLTGLLAVSSAWGGAPLNPALPWAEMEALLRDLNPAAVVVSAEFAALREGVLQLGLTVFSAGEDGETGWILLANGRQPIGARQGLARQGFPQQGLAQQGLARQGFGQQGFAPTEAAVLLHTSATTGRSKLVGLSHANLNASMASTVAVLELTPADRVLLLSPLFHLQGILSAMSQLRAGGSVIAPRGFERGDLPRWLRELKPTWYTCGPALHRTICARLRSHGGGEGPAPAAASLRFVRSIGAPLCSALAAEIYATLGVPVLNGYGLTETGVLTSVPPEYALTHTGSVGRTTGAELCIVHTNGDAEEQEARPGTEGEIVVRGANVTSGYMHDDEGNAEAFRGGWFHTGDLGRMDADGFLYVTGRLKEQINRAGEKIHPGEVDDVLLSHADVLEAAAFGVPHPSVGENIFCAVVLKPGATVTSAALRQFAAGQIAGFKVPRRIYFVDRIPRGATGKPKRHVLTAAFGSAAPGQEAIALRAPRA